MLSEFRRCAHEWFAPLGGGTDMVVCRVCGASKLLEPEQASKSYGASLSPFSASGTPLPKRIAHAAQREKPYAVEYAEEDEEEDWEYNLEDEEWEYDARRGMLLLSASDKY